ncbi:MAG: DUF1427 family protein [Clostridia bacterium]|nr:DUF1427 family protein [Clostridia bacterium]
MKEVIMATLTGLAVGVLFSFLKLPLPAPPTLAGVMGIVGMFVGFIIMNHIF